MTAITPWIERVHALSTSYENQDAMQAEIAELRAALVSAREEYQSSMNHQNCMARKRKDRIDKLEAALAAQGEQAKPLSDEQDRALCEANCNAEADAFFEARPTLDFPEMRRIFYAGHRRAWISKDSLTKSAHGIGKEKT